MDGESDCKPIKKLKKRHRKSLVPLERGNNPFHDTDEMTGKRRTNQSLEPPSPKRAKESHSAGPKDEDLPEIDYSEEIEVIERMGIMDLDFTSENHTGATPMLSGLDMTPRRSGDPEPDRRFEEEYESSSDSPDERVDPPLRGVQLHGPRRFSSENHTCTNCEESIWDHGRPKYLCLVCERLAYCTLACQEAGSKIKCNDTCKKPAQKRESRQVKKSPQKSSLKLHGPRKFSTKDQTCTNCTDRILDLCRIAQICLKCGRFAFCGAACQEANAGWNCNDTCRPDAPDASANDAIRLSPTASSPPVIASFSKAPPAALTHKTTGIRPDGYEIIDFRIFFDASTLQYQLEQNSSPRSRCWVNAETLFGNAWTKKMEDFWFLDIPRCDRRDCHEDPDGICNEVDSRDPELPRVEPGPFGRFVLRMQIEDERILAFDVRENEERNVDRDGPDWRMSVELGDEWDEALGRYWTKVEVAESWQKAAGGRDAEDEAHELNEDTRKEADEPNVPSARNDFSAAVEE